MAASTTTLSVLNITSFENLAEKITTFLPHGWSIFLLEDGVCLTYQSLNPGKLESVWERTLVLGQPTQAHSTNRMYEIITKTKGSDTVDCSTVFVSSLIDVLKLLDLSHSSTAPPPPTSMTTTTASTQPQLSGELPEARATEPTQPPPPQQQPRLDPASVSSFNKPLQLATTNATNKSTSDLSATQDNAVLVQNTNGLVTSIDLYNCGQENGGFDFSGFDVTMMTGGNAQAAGSASPVGGVVPSVSLLSSSSCVSATAITPSVTQAVGLPDEESRTAAATTVDRLFNLGLTEVKEEAGDGSGLDVGARVVKTELVVLKGLDATVDDEEDDASSQAGLVHDHDPHDIGPLVTLNVADLEPVKSPEDLLGSFAPKNGYQQQHQIQDPQQSRKTTVLNIEIPCNDASRFVAAINEKISCVPASSTNSTILSPDNPLAVVAAAQEQPASHESSPAPSSTSDNSSSNSSSSSTTALQGRRVKRNNRSIFASSSVACSSIGVSPNVNTVAMNVNSGSGTFNVVSVGNIIPTNVTNSTVQIYNANQIQFTPITLTPTTILPTTTTIDASALGLVATKPKKKRRNKEGKNKGTFAILGDEVEKESSLSAAGSGGKKFNCIYCPLTFATQCALKMHATQHSFKCSSCHKIFVNRGALTEHRKQEHFGNDGEAGYRCKKCKRTFTRKFNWTKHLANKSCNGDNVVAECKMENGSEKIGGQSNHVDLYTHTCSQCSKVYKNVSDLNRHTRFVHYRIRPYKCQLCPSSFPQSGGLKEHMRIHTGEKPFVCPVCGMRFTRNFNMKEHLTKHGSSKPYQCRFCEENFQTRHIRRRHEQDVHRSILKEQLKEELQ